MLTAAADDDVNGNIDDGADDDAFDSGNNNEGGANANDRILLPSFSLLGSTSRALFAIQSYGDDDDTDEILLSFDDNESFVSGNDNRSGVDVIVTLLLFHVATVCRASRSSSLFSLLSRLLQPLLDDAADGTNGIIDDGANSDDNIDDGASVVNDDNSESFHSSDPFDGGNNN